MYIIGDLEDIENVTDFQRVLAEWKEREFIKYTVSFDAFYWMWVVELILEAADDNLPTIYYSRIDGLLLVDNEELF